MAVTDVKKDFDALSLTITSEFGAAIERVWELLGRPTQAGILVGSADVSSDVHRLPLCGGEHRSLLHDQS